jgi:hypothetical protein
VNTPTFTWAYTRILKKGGKREMRNSIDSVAFPMQWDAVYLKKKRKIGNEKYSQNNNNHNKSGKVEMGQL